MEIKIFSDNINDVVSATKRTARSCHVKVLYNNKNITKDITPHLVNFTYNDVATDKADDISLTLEDTDNLWINDWFPDKGDTLYCEIIVKRWQHERDNRSLPCGLFEIDEITASSPQRKIEIKAISVPNNGVKTEKRSKAWNATTLEHIAKDIATRASLELFYDAPIVKFERKDQSEQSDLAFLRGLCVESGCGIKVNDSQIIIFEQLKYEQKDSVMPIFNYGIVSYKITSSSSHIYTSAKVEYLDNTKKEKTNHTYTPPPPSPRVLADMHKQKVAPKVEKKAKEPQEKNLDEKEGDKHKGKHKQLIIHTRASSKAEAETIAKNALRQTNKNEIKGTLTVMGDPQLQSCLNVDLVGFGAFDGKYFIDSVKHDCSSGYVSTIEVHQCINF